MKRQQRAKLSAAELLDLEQLVLQRTGMVIRDVLQLVEHPQQRAGVVCLVTMAVFNTAINMISEHYTEDTGRPADRKATIEMLATECAERAMVQVPK
jgi:hypothetical protein